MGLKTAQMATASTSPQRSTITPKEVEGFAAYAHEWWDERGKFAPLHRINPARIRYIRDRAVAHFARAGESATPLVNLTLIDVGCGGGLLCEPMARLGARITGIDAAEASIAVAKRHAAEAQLPIDYRTATPEELATEGKQFDIVLALEIIEHVADPALFYEALAKLTKPGGLLILSTLNRTAKSFALGIVGAEYVLRWVPRGTHQWSQFVKPSEMAEALISHGFSVHDTTGLVFDPLAWSFRLDPKDLGVNYFLTVSKNR